MTTNFDGNVEKQEAHADENAPYRGWSLYEGLAFYRLFHEHPSPY